MQMPRHRKLLQLGLPSPLETYETMFQMWALIHSGTLGTVRKDPEKPWEMRGSLVQRNETCELHEKNMVRASWFLTVVIAILWQSWRQEPSAMGPWVSFSWGWEKRLCQVQLRSDVQGTQWDAISEARIQAVSWGENSCCTEVGTCWRLTSCHLVYLCVLIECCLDCATCIMRLQAELRERQEQDRRQRLIEQTRKEFRPQEIHLSFGLSTFTGVWCWWLLEDLSLKVLVEFNPYFLLYPGSLSQKLWLCHIILPACSAASPCPIWRHLVIYCNPSLFRGKTLEDHARYLWCVSACALGNGMPQFLGLLSSLVSEMVCKCKVMWSWLWCLRQELQQHQYFTEKLAAGQQIIDVEGASLEILKDRPHASQTGPSVGLARVRRSGYFFKNTDARIGVLSIKRFKTGMGSVVVRWSSLKVSSNPCIMMLHLPVPCVSLVSSSLPVCTWECLRISELQKAIDLDDLLLVFGKGRRS